MPTGPSPGRSLSLLLAGLLRPVPAPGTPSRVSPPKKNPSASSGAGAKSRSPCTLLCRTLSVRSRLCYGGEGSLNGTVSFSTASMGTGSPCAAARIEVGGTVLRRTPELTSVGVSHGMLPSLGCARDGTAARSLFWEPLALDGPRVAPVPCS